MITDINFGGQTGLNTSFLQPTQGKNLYAGNYLNFTNGSINQWAQQFLPDVYDKEVEIYGNRTISSFLRMVSAEMPSTSDQIIWQEQGRLHTRYSNLSQVAALPANSTTVPTSTDSIVRAAAADLDGGSTIHFALNAQRGPGTAQGNFVDTTEGDAFINFRVGQTVMIQQQSVQTTGNAARIDDSRGTGAVIKGVVIATNNIGFSVTTYRTVSQSISTAATRYTALAYGSEFAKGTGNFTEKLDPSYSTYQNSPIILKEHYAINGSDVSQIGWIEVTSENGASGYLWYVKSEHENRLRWEDYIEMSMVEGVTQQNTGATLQTYRRDFSTGDDANAGPTGYNRGTQTARGTEGFFQALETRGNLYTGLAEELGAVTSTTNAGIDILAGSFDNILKQLDKQGAIEENMLYVNRDLALSFDNFLARQNNYGGTAGTSWGVFNNSKDMAIDLGFSGFRRGSYDFYKTDWKYLNDFSTRGGFGDIQGVMIPAGTSTVYDQGLGKNIKRPFLHVRYRSSETENRKMKSWITGSVGGAYTTDVDEMRMHYLTERCLITQGANNFFLMTAE